MPIYEYHCESCEHDFELLVNASSTPECPDCHSKKLSKKFSTFAAAGTQTRVAAPHKHTPTCGCGKPHGSCGMN
ncbi:MAG: zinc ribbon domain-containing protein [Verrucomicrobiota bacterium]|nr:zinc ribbon domain-containing protein [Verrucomicrobiota bacterium]